MEDFPKPVTKKCTKKILKQMDQMENLIYKIYKSNKKINDIDFGFGIFCKIKINKNVIPILVTNYQIIDLGYLKNYKEIKISINNEDKIIEFTDKYYTNKEYNISIIEIKEKEGNKINYLEISESK